jgi:hypothetical protein
MSTKLSAGRVRSTYERQRPSRRVQRAGDVSHSWPRPERALRVAHAADSRDIYGAPCVFLDLREAGTPTSRATLAGLEPRYPRCRVSPRPGNRSHYAVLPRLTTSYAELMGFRFRGPLGCDAGWSRRRSPASLSTDARSAGMSRSIGWLELRDHSAVPNEMPEPLARARPHHRVGRRARPIRSARQPYGAHDQSVVRSPRRLCCISTSPCSAQR